MATIRNSIADSSRRSRYHFSLRTLLVSVAIVAGVLVIANNYLRPKIEHRIAVGRIFASGGRVWFEGTTDEYSNVAGSQWRDVDGIDVWNDNQALLVAQELTRIPEAGCLHFNTGVTDKGLSEFCDPRRSASIEAIDFYKSAVSSVGLSKLVTIPNLRYIMFNTNPVDSTMLAQLKMLPRLERLTFVEERPLANPNRLNDQCFAEIGQLVNLQELVFGDVNVSESAARELHKLKQLKSLSFHKGHISNSAVSELRTALPTTEIDVY